MRIRLPVALAIALSGVAMAQTAASQAPTGRLPHVQMPSSPKSGSALTLPIPPVAPSVPGSAGQTAADSVATAAQLALMRAAQEAQADLRSLMQSLASASKTKASERAATSNPCERTGYGASLSCIDDIRRRLGRVKLPAAEKAQVDADLTVLRDSLKGAQYAGAPRQRDARLAEAKVRADRLDLTLAKLAEPRAPATAGLSLDKLIPGLTN